MKYYLAVDIGASSGRHIVGWLKDGEIMTEEVYRFANFPDKIGDNLTWDINRLFSEVKTGIAAAFKKYPEIESMAIDTWGVDYVLMDGEKEIIPCFCYRDGRTKNAIKRVHGIIPFEQLYSISGIQFQPFNTVYQLYSDLESGRLDKATDFLMLPEYLSFKLTGIKKKEYTNATTTGLINVKTAEFDKGIIEKSGLPPRLFTGLYKPGELVGQLKSEIAAEVGGNLKVKLCASHDTASAFESVDTPDDSVILSSGTWSLLGIKSKIPLNSAEALKANFTNEGGNGYIRFIKNITGLWIIGQLKKELKMGFDEMSDLARQSDFRSAFDINSDDFTAPPSMAAAICGWFLLRGISPPKTNADIISSAYHSLAQSYKIAVEGLESVLDKKFDKIYIIGGGAKDGFLNELTALYTKKEVVPMPIEATSIGNLKIQINEEAKEK